MWCLIYFFLSSAEDRLMIFLLLVLIFFLLVFCPENRLCHLMQNVSLGGSLHEVIKPVFRKK